MTQGSLDVALFLLRITLGGMILLHGYNHLFGPGGVEGTARWFASLGFRPAKVHALMSGWIELAAGAGLILGFFHAFAGAALIGIMCVAGVAAHRPNGFFKFRDGYTIGLVDYDDPTSAGLLGRTGGLLAGLLGGGGAAALLITSWRPVRKAGTAKVP